MDKISGIIPSSPRLQSVDLRDAAPVRPGTPSFGRPEGVSSLSTANMPKFEVPTTAQRAGGIQMQQMDWRTKDQFKAGIAAELSNRFFMKNDQPAEQIDMSNGAGAYAAGLPVGLNAVSSRPAGFKTEDLSAPSATLKPIRTFDETPEEEEQTSEPPQLQQPEGLFPKGSFIDRTA